MLGFCSTVKGGAVCPSLGVKQTDFGHANQITVTIAMNRSYRTSISAGVRNRSDRSRSLLGAAVYSRHKISPPAQGRASGWTSREARSLKSGPTKEEFRKEGSPRGERAKAETTNHISFNETEFVPGRSVTPVTLEQNPHTAARTISGAFRSPPNPFGPASYCGAGFRLRRTPLRVRISAE